ncbi:hypothetical protein V2O64_12445 [Verrucomicrobiaceae bacterium 227]
MKTTTLKAVAAIGLSALLAGSAAAQESKSKPVGYETLTVANGFNYLGLRLHEAPVASDVSVDVDGAVVTVAAGIVDALEAGTSYLLEVVDGDAEGAVVPISAFDGASNTVTVSDASLGDDFGIGDGFTIRPIATLATVFGADNTAGLDEGQGGTGGADQVWVPDGLGGFGKYYFDSENFDTFGRTWTDATDGKTIVDPTAVNLVYTDGIILVGAGTDNNTFVVSGSVKLTSTAFVVTDGFNYLSSVSPAGATLESMFGLNNSAALSTGQGGTGGADQVWVPTVDGFDKYYYDIENFDTFDETWTDASDGKTVVTASAVSLDGASGFILVNTGGGQMVSTAAPSFYSSL